MEDRFGVTIPLGGPLHSQRDVIARLPSLGFTDVWSSEVDDTDGFTPLVLASQWAPALRLGVAVVPAFTRGPALLAQSAASLADAAPGRFVLGIGASTDTVVTSWNDIEFDEPYRRVRDMVRFLHDAFQGDRVSREYDTFAIDGFRLGRIPEEPPKILLAALRPGMLRLAGAEADGAILNWLSAEDVATVVPHVREAGPDKEIVARIFVAPTEDAEAVRQQAKFLLAAYLNVPAYAAFHQWLGRGEQLGPMWTAWERGDRKRALAAVPDSLVDELIVYGSPEECRRHIRRYHDNGVNTSAVAVIPIGADRDAALRHVAPLS